MIIWLKEGESSYEVGRRLNCPHSKPLYWQKRYQEEGITGLVTKQRSGRPLQIPDDKEASIHKQLEDKNFWHTKWVYELVFKETGIKYSQRHIVRLMHKWGFELITPRKVHIQTASEEQKKEFLKKTKKYWVLSLKIGT